MLRASGPGDELEEDTGGDTEANTVFEPIYKKTVPNSKDYNLFLSFSVMGHPNKCVRHPNKSIDLLLACFSALR